MADVRALLRAKREEQRIVHPFAAYNPSGALRCTACGTIVKHASAWNGHVGSKPHRTNVARLKEEEKLREEGKRQVKRKSDEDSDTLEEPAKKRRVEEDDMVGQGEPSSSSGFPTDFFSDPSRSLPMNDAESDEDIDQGNLARKEPQPQSAIDLEWAKFQEAVINAPAEAEDRKEMFERATIVAEPQLTMEIPEGFPSIVAAQPTAQRAASPIPTDEETLRRKRAEEEKELIMDRLLDEERAQEEADERVNALKAKLELVKQKRMAAKAVNLNK